VNLETKVPLELIGNIYDTALDATLWPGVLKNLTEFVANRPLRPSLGPWRIPS